jgi:hypothetical protein
MKKRFLQIDETPVIIELGMESQNFYIGLILLASFLFILWFFVGRKGGYGRPTVLDLKKGESRVASGSSGPSAPSHGVPQKEPFAHDRTPKMRDVTPPNPTALLQKERLVEDEVTLDNIKTPPLPETPPSCFFIYNGHDWDAYEVLGLSPYSSFSELTRVYQQQIKKADSGKHEFLQTAYMAILKKL